MHDFVIGDYRNVPVPARISLVIADPVYDSVMVGDIISMIHNMGVPGIVFSSIADLYRLGRTPEQTAFWIKQPSTKNTINNYSCFAEAITFWNNIKFYEKLHWSARTGLFFDSIIDGSEHVWKKPESLIEKLIRLHYPGTGIVYDPCAGSGTTHVVCRRLGIPSFCVEIQAR